MCRYFTITSLIKSGNKTTEKQFGLFLHDSKYNMDLVSIDLLNVELSAKNQVIWRKTD